MIYLHFCKSKNEWNTGQKMLTKYLVKKKIFESLFFLYGSKVLTVVRWYETFLCFFFLFIPEKTSCIHHAWGVFVFCFLQKEMECTYTSAD